MLRDYVAYSAAIALTDFVRREILRAALLRCRTFLVTALSSKTVAVQRLLAASSLLPAAVASTTFFVAVFRADL